MSASDSARVKQAVEGLADLLREMRLERSSANVNINAGGAGVWSVVTACIAMVVLNICMGFALLSFSQKLDEQGHQLNAIYMMAPGLHQQVREYLREEEK